MIGKPYLHLSNNWGLSLTQSNRMEYCMDCLIRKLSVFRWQKVEKSFLKKLERTTLCLRNQKRSSGSSFAESYAATERFRKIRTEIVQLDLVRSFHYWPYSDLAWGHCLSGRAQRLYDQRSPPWPSPKSISKVRANVKAGTCNLDILFYLLKGLGRTECMRRKTGWDKE